MFEKIQQSSNDNEIDHEIDKAILLVAENLERTLIDLRQCETDLLRGQIDTENFKKNFQNSLEMLDEEVDKINIQRLNSELKEMIKIKTLYLSQMEEILRAFNSAYESQMSTFEKLKNLKIKREYGFSGTSH